MVSNAFDIKAWDAVGRSTMKSVLGDEVPARQEQGDTEHQPSCRIEQHIAPDAMGD